MNYSLETLTRPQWEGGRQVKAAAAFTKEKPQHPPNISSLLSTSLFVIYLSILLCLPPALSGALLSSLVLAFSSLSTPPSSLRTPDTAHVQCFVWQCPFITGLNGKSICNAEVHLMAVEPACRARMDM